MSRAGLGFAIRRATAGDIPFLSLMLVEAAYPLADPKPLLAEALAFGRAAAYLDGWGRPGDHGLVAVATEDGTQAGAAWYRLFSPTAPGFGFVDASTPEITIAVLPGLRGRGLGSSLLAALVEHARRDGFRKLGLSVDQRNRARRLYERHGFARVPSGRPLDDGARPRGAGGP